MKQAAALLAALALAAPPAAAAAPDQFRHDVARVGGHLRVAVEYAPEELTEALWSAKTVCALGERAEARQDEDLATADRRTLNQLIDEVAEADADRIDAAFRRADSTLVSLRSRWARRWSSDRKAVHGLHAAVDTTRRGIVIMRRVVARLAIPFADWRASKCAAATGAVEAAFAEAPEGLELINVGMLELWRLPEVGSSSNKRSI